MRVPRQDAAPRYLTVPSEDAVQRYTGIHPLTNTVHVNPPSSPVQLTNQIYSYLVESDHETCELLDDGTVDSDVHGQGELGVAAAPARRMPNGKLDRRSCSAGDAADDWERSAALERKEGTRLPLRHEAGEAAVQRTRGRTHPVDDKPDVLQEWSRVAEKRQSEQQEGMTRRQSHRIWHRRIPEVSARLSSTKA